VIRTVDRCTLLARIRVVETDSIPTLQAGFNVVGTALVTALGTRRRVIRTDPVPAVFALSTIGRADDLFTGFTRVRVCGAEIVSTLEAGLRVVRTGRGLTDGTVRNVVLTLHRSAVVDITLYRVGGTGRLTAVIALNPVVDTDAAVADEAVFEVILTEPLGTVNALDRVGTTATRLAVPALDGVVRTQAVPALLTGRTIGRAGPGVAGRTVLDVIVTERLGTVATRDRVVGAEYISTVATRLAVVRTDCIVTLRTVLEVFRPRRDVAVLTVADVVVAVVLVTVRAVEGVIRTDFLLTGATGHDVVVTRDQVADRTHCRMIFTDVGSANRALTE
jgi:hypothetical protein